MMAECKAFILHTASLTSLWWGPNFDPCGILTVLIYPCALGCLHGKLHSDTPWGCALQSPRTALAWPRLTWTSRGDVPALPTALEELPQVKLFTATEPEQQENLWKGERAETVVSGKS